VSRVLGRVERVLNYCFPKSLVLYAERRAGAARAAG
jgi:hypothetical protein